MPNASKISPIAARKRAQSSGAISRSGSSAHVARRCDGSSSNTLSGSIPSDTIGVNVHLTVIIPTFRRAGLLERALGSVLAQDWQDWDAVVVDDGDGEGIEAARG